MVFLLIFISSTLARKKAFTAILAQSSKNSLNHVLKTSDMYTLYIIYKAMQKERFR